MNKIVKILILSSIIIIPSIILYCKFFSISKHHQEPTKQISKKVLNESIMNKALSIELAVTNNITSSEVDNLINQATKKVFEANYAEALKITIEGIKKFPNNFALQSDLASLIGDYSEIINEPLKNKMIEKSKEIFNRLNKEVDDQPKDDFFTFKNEYYYRFARYKEQYELGLSRVDYYWNKKEMATKGFRGYYSQGVGAANYARILIKEGNKKLALDYAQKAIVAWAQYFGYKNDYYNAYVHYSMALGILGYKQEMMRALIKSARLINKDLSYFEFKEVIDFVNSIK
jgi:tetratricopeptide (TPR) repeat protein